MIFLVVLLVLTIPSAICNSDGMCPEYVNFFWAVLINYLKDQYIITAIALQDSSLILADQLLRCVTSSYIEQIVPIVSYVLPRGVFLGSTEYGSYYDTFPASVIHSYILVAESTDELIAKILMLQMANPNAKSVLITNNGKDGDHEKILKFCWEEQKMLNVMSMMIDVDVQRGKFNMTISNTANISVAMYNPFIWDNGQRGVVYIFHLTEFNYQNVISRFSEIVSTRLKNVQGYPLRISIFEFQGMSKAIYDKNGTVFRYVLPDGNLVHTMSSAMNFTPIYSSPRDNMTYGFKNADNILTGGLGDLEYGYADLSGNLRIIKDYGSNNSVFIFPMDDTSYCYLTPKQSDRTKLLSISTIGIFNDTAQAWVLIMLFLIAVTWWIQQKIYLCIKCPRNRRKRQTVSRTPQLKIYSAINTKKYKSRSVIEIVMLIFATHYYITQNSPTRDFERCLYLGALLFSIITCNTYQGTIVTQLTTNIGTNDINDLEQLVKSGLKIASMVSIDDLMGNINHTEEGSIYHEIAKKQFVFTNMSKALESVAKWRDTAVLMPEIFGIIFQSVLYAPDGRELTHILLKGPPKFYSGSMVPKFSPYFQKFNSISMRIMEQGLMRKWKEETIHLAQLQRFHRVISKLYENKRKFTLKEYWFLFAFWALCLTLAFVVFLLEIFFYRYQVHHGTIRQRTE